MYPLCIRGCYFLTTEAQNSWRYTESCLVKMPFGTSLFYSPWFSLPHSRIPDCKTLLLRHTACCHRYKNLQCDDRKLWQGPCLSAFPRDKKRMQVLLRHRKRSLRHLLPIVFQLNFRYWLLQEMATSFSQGRCHCR